MTRFLWPALFFLSCPALLEAKPLGGDKSSEANDVGSSEEKKLLVLESDELPMDVAAEDEEGKPTVPALKESLPVHHELHTKRIRRKPTRGGENPPFDGPPLPLRPSRRLVPIGSHPELRPPSPAQRTFDQHRQGPPHGRPPPEFRHPRPHADFGHRDQPAGGFDNGFPPPFPSRSEGPGPDSRGPPPQRSFGPPPQQGFSPNEGGRGPPPQFASRGFDDEGPPPGAVGPDSPDYGPGRPLPNRDYDSRRPPPSDYDSRRPSPRDYDDYGGGGGQGPPPSHSRGPPPGGPPPRHFPPPHQSGGPQGHPPPPQRPHHPPPRPSHDGRFSPPPPQHHGPPPPHHSRGPPPPHHTRGPPPPFSPHGGPHHFSPPPPRHQGPPPPHRGGSPPRFFSSSPPPFHPGPGPRGPGPRGPGPRGPGPRGPGGPEHSFQPGPGGPHPPPPHSRGPPPGGPHPHQPSQQNRYPADLRAARQHPYHTTEPPVEYLPPSKERIVGATPTSDPLTVPPANPSNVHSQEKPYIPPRPDFRSPPPRLPSRSNGRDGHPPPHYDGQEEPYPKDERHDSAPVHAHQEEKGTADSPHPSGALRHPVFGSPFFVDGDDFYYKVPKHLLSKFLGFKV